MSMSEAVTKGTRVSVEAQFDPERSRPDHGLWFFLYTVTISNESLERVQLMTRHWIITSGEGAVEEVKGAGVVGHQPRLEPGESFTYTSGCPLKTPFGTMHGSYRMVTRDGESFEAEVAPFELSAPYSVN